MVEELLEGVSTNVTVPAPPRVWSWSVNELDDVVVAVPDVGYSCEITPGVTSSV